MSQYELLIDITWRTDYEIFIPVKCPIQQKPSKFCEDNILRDMGDTDIHTCEITHNGAQQQAPLQAVMNLHKPQQATS